MSTPQNQRFRIDWLASQYMEAVESGDFDAMEKLWKLAEQDEALVAAFQQVHEDLLAEQGEKEAQATVAQITEAVADHIPSAKIPTAATGPVTVGDVALELFENTPDRLPAEAHALNEKLRQSKEPLPKELGLTKFIAWAESKFGSATQAYWKAFRQAALDLELKRSADTEYQLAARSAPKPGDKK